MDGTDQSPEMAAAKQQIDAMTQELNRTVDAIQQMQQGFEAQKLQIDSFKAEVQAYDAETKRISAVQASMTPEQIQDIVMGTIAAAVDTGDLIASMPSSEAMEPRGMIETQEMPMEPQMAPPAPPQMGM